MTTEERRLKILEIEMEVRDAALRGTGLVVNPEDMTLVNRCDRELQRLTNGRNRVIFNRLGQPNIMVWFPCDEKARVEYLSNSGAYFDVPSDWSDSANGVTTGVERGIYSVHPAFVFNPLNRSNMTRGSAEIAEGFYLGKYSDVKVEGTNYHVSLPMLAPANYQSYNSLASSCDTINAGTVMPDAPCFGNNTLAIMSYIALLSLREGFQCHGNTQFGGNNKKAGDYGEPSGVIAGGRIVTCKGGSGSLQWYHDATPEGVWGLTGNVFEILHGFCIKNMELNFIPNNNAVDSTAALLNCQTSSEWKGMDANGNYIDCLSSGTVKYDFVYDYSTRTETTDFYQTYELCTAITHTPTSAYTGCGSVSGLNEVGVRASDFPEGKPPLTAQLLTMVKLNGGSPSGTWRNARWNLQSGEKIVLVGGGWFNGSSAGVFTSDGSWSSSSSGSFGGGRVALIKRRQVVGRSGI